MDNLYWSTEFKDLLSTHCNQLFLDYATDYYVRNKTIHDNANVNILEITEYIRANNLEDRLSKVKFCVAWINSLSIIGDNVISGSVIIDNQTFNCYNHTDFTSYLQKISIITQDEQNAINQEWLDITNGEPYYSL